MFQLLHEPVPPVDLPPVPVLDHISLPNKPLLLELPPRLRHTHLPARTLTQFYALFDRLREGVVTLHLVLEVGASTSKFMWVFIFNHNRNRFFLN